MRWSYIKNGESLKLDRDACTGCGACVEVCPHAVFALGERKAEILERTSCMECGACAKNCPSGAITVKAGVGCAAAILNGILRGTEPSCDCGCASENASAKESRAESRSLKCGGEGDRPSCGCSSGMGRKTAKSRCC